MSWGYLLDTNVPSELTRPQPDGRVAQWLEDIDDDLMYISVVTIAEVFKGITIHPESHRREWLLRWLKNELRPWFAGRILPVTEAIAERCGVLESQCHLKGLGLISRMGSLQPRHWRAILQSLRATSGTSQSSALRF